MTGWRFRQLQKSRKRVHAGDIFVMQVHTGDYLFGRVIRDDAMWPLDRTRGALLVYVYSEVSKGKNPPARLDPMELLIPPRLTNRLGWSRGYFETVEHRPLSSADVLERHAFRLLTSGDLLDEGGKPVTGEPSEPIGYWALDGYGSINRDVNKALGLPLPERE